MLNNEKLAYDLALIYAKTKFEVANKNGVFGALYPDDEPEKEIKALAVFFNNAYNQYLSYDLSEITEL
mgnify:CR=1 FL=1